MAQQRTAHPVLGIWLIFAGVVGWFAAFMLTVEKFELLKNPDAGLACDISPLVQCSANLDSWQGSVFGFPNPILGLTGWVAVIVVGAALLFGIRLTVWFWRVFWAGIVGAMVFVIWLISQSIFILGTLCPWCMVTWSVTIPTFFVVTFHLLRIGGFSSSEKAKKLGATLMGWVPLFTVASYAIIVLLAQFRLDAITKIFAA